MLNRDGISKKTYGAPTQILANVELQESVGCIVPQSLVASADANGKKIAKAGTPIHIDFTNLQTPAAAVVANSPMNAVLLHDVDVTAGNANGTALIFGIVNLNRVGTAVATAIASAQAVAGATTNVMFIKA